MLARRGVDREELAAPIELRLAQPSFAVRDSGAVHERAERLERAMHRQAIRRSKNPRAPRARALRPADGGRRQPRAASLERRRRDRRAQIGRDVRDDFGGFDAHQLCEQLVVRVLAVDRRRRRSSQSKRPRTRAQTSRPPRRSRRGSCSACRRGAVLRSAFPASRGARRRDARAGWAAGARAVRRAPRRSAAARAARDTASSA